MRQLQVITSDGMRVNTLFTDGPGRPVLFLGSFLMPAETWLPLLSSLPSRHCILMDLRGQGESDPIPVSQTSVPFTTHVRDAYAVMAAFGHRQYHVVGLGMGGQVAIEATLQRPGRVLSLTLISCHGNGEWSSRMEEFTAFLDALNSQGWVEPVLDRVLMRILSPTAYADEELRHGMARQLRGLEPTSVVSLGRGLATCPSRRHDFTMLSMPVLALIGGADQLADPVLQRRAAQDLPRGTVVEFPGWGHPSWEQPVRAAEHLQAHLTAAEAAAASR